MHNLDFCSHCVSGKVVVRRQTVCLRHLSVASLQCGCTVAEQGGTGPQLSSGEVANCRLEGQLCGA